MALPEPGVVLGTYRLESILGQGSMARVYRAIHQKLGREVALKMLLPEAAENERIRDRFFGEARALNRIHHDHLVAVTDFVEQGALQFYVMELLEGRTLAEMMTGTLTLSRSVGIWLQLADVLAALHEDHVVHRDLKPENIFISTRSTLRDFVKLMDFGVARILDREGAVILPADPGAIVGTPAYMAPEQGNGADVDDLADIYSFGVLMYEMVTARLPVDSDDVRELLRLKQTMPPRRPSQEEILREPVPRALDDLIHQCLQIDPADRPQSMQEVRLRLASLAIAGDVIDAPPATELPLPGETAPERRRRRQKRRRTALAVLGIVGAAVAGAATSKMLLKAEPSPSAVGKASSSPAAAANSQPQAPEPQPPPKEFSLSTKPPGARVFMGRRLLGKTPLQWSAPRKVLPTTLRFELSGFQSARMKVDLEHDSRLSVELQKNRSPNKRKRRGKKRRSSRP